MRIMRNNACALFFPGAFNGAAEHRSCTHECQHLKTIADSPLRCITVGTAIKTTTTATPKIPSNTLAMGTCSEVSEQKSDTRTKASTNG